MEEYYGGGIPFSAVLKGTKKTKKRKKDNKKRKTKMQKNENKCNCKINKN